MEEYVLLFRMDITTKSAQPTTSQMKVYMEQWMGWLDALSKNNRLGDGGNHFSTDGAVIRPGNKITKGPYAVSAESVAGYINIRAKNIDDAIQVASDCPILQGNGTSVEIRKLENL
jgi:hypothetical protein